MNIPRFLAIALVLGGSTLTAACATSSDAPVVDEQPDSSFVDNYVAPYDSGQTTVITLDAYIAPEIDAATSVCAPTCSADSECQSTCPAASSGSVYCCDTATSVCYESASSTCPMAADTQDADVPD